MRDLTLPLFLNGYRALSGLPEAHTARLLGRPTLFLRGPEGARLFYDDALLTREGAIPPAVARTLFGRGTVHGLDGAAHRHRKAMFTSLLGEKAAADITEIAATGWRVLLAPGREVVLFDAAVAVLGGAVCMWAGVPVEPGRIGDLASIVDGFGSVGPRHLRARLARRRSTGWATRLVERVRAGRVPAEGALAVIAGHVDEDGEPLPAPVAADELINVLRPTVAVAWFVAFAGLALHRHPEWRARVGDPEAARAFAHEVRRRFPFAPLLAARSRIEFTWRGHRVRTGGLVVLDLYGSDMDPVAWDSPRRFDPARFLGREPGPFEVLAQGGGDPHTGHKCPGEAFTVTLLADAVTRLAASGFEVPPQDLRYRWSEVPTRPRSGVNIRLPQVPAV
ncbi:fatty-acid peroxygenase [Actinorhabdospora filicis]|uniref:Fatty-acid peroxygenase n=1 Tax=Actinorhabdospora filicis TaxID=1785913 RepID=A0A9W6SQ12_9ACTN|nr:cytochrome P450 [Actinorhabdospora filicis]GLZ80253.1 fatty-acid peroxygenase [Actinorhabdospora filicis]